MHTAAVIKAVTAFVLDKARTGVERQQAFRALAQTLPTDRPGSGSGRGQIEVWNSTLPTKEANNLLRRLEEEQGLPFRLWGRETVLAMLSEEDVVDTLLWGTPATPALPGWAKAVKANPGHVVWAVCGSRLVIHQMWRSAAAVFGGYAPKETEESLPIVGAMEVDAWAANARADARAKKDWPEDEYHPPAKIQERTGPQGLQYAYGSGRTYAAIARLGDDAWAVGVGVYHSDWAIEAQNSLAARIEAADGARHQLGMSLKLLDLARSVGL